MAGAYLYSFALRANDASQPSGSLNMSRIDNSTLVVETKGLVDYTADPANLTDVDAQMPNEGADCTQLLVFGESYNILRILSGMVRFLTCQCLHRLQSHTPLFFTTMQGGLAYSS